MEVITKASDDDDVQVTLSPRLALDAGGTPPVSSKPLSFHCFLSPLKCAQSIMSIGLCLARHAR